MFLGSTFFSNERADSMAKSALQQVLAMTYSVITFTRCKSLIFKQVTTTWQQRWGRSVRGRTTYEMVPSVGSKIIFSKNRCTTIRYTRLLLNDTTLRAHQYRRGLADTKVCECNQWVKDVYHFFQCTLYKETRKQLLQFVQKLWKDAGYKGSPRWSVTLLLAPSYLGVFSSEQSQDILFATFDYHALAR